MCGLTFYSHVKHTLSWLHHFTKGGWLGPANYFNLPFFIEVPVLSQESEISCISIMGVDFPLSTCLPIGYWKSSESKAFFLLLFYDILYALWLVKLWSYVLEHYILAIYIYSVAFSLTLYSKKKNDARDVYCCFVFFYKTSWTPPRFISVPVLSQESERQLFVRYASSYDFHIAFWQFFVLPNSGYMLIFCPLSGLLNCNNIFFSLFFIFYLFFLYFSST